MILTAHLLTGAAIASKISNPALAFPLAFLSHYLLDLPPQTEYEVENIKKARWHKASSDFLKVFLDIFFGMLLIILFSDGSPIIFAAAFLAIVPDGLHLLNLIFPRSKPLAWHQRLHSAINLICNSKIQKRATWEGIIIQVIIILTAIFLLRG
ncbi:MAG: hypothetical protein DRZ76_00055 [Candidatus Nealsonbacteria bacterium]|nr:MAG: hypothetical protein DRZ76_00055 [Candidatus Nealsonbacteria bacterium]